MNEEYTEKQQISLNDRFKFSCHKGLSCFNTCCADTNIFLTPYDVLRMRKATWLSSGDFLNRYTIALLGDEELPLIVLKMMEDENKTCPFLTLDGCMIYQDRPWSCRMYPIFPISSNATHVLHGNTKDNENNPPSPPFNKGGMGGFSGEEEFLIEEKPSCLGFKEGKEWTIEDWRNGQGINIYDKMNESYKEITFHDYFSASGGGNKLDSGRAKMLYMACYDLNEFKKFLFETRFFDIYDVEKEVIEKIKEDEEELLSFGYRWVRFNLFSEDTLRLKDKEMDKLLKSKPTCRQVGTSVIARLDRAIQTPSPDLIGGTTKELDSLVKPENDIFRTKD
ncbi:MAG: YkgJ family cysteine cluster protein [Nitrospirae bacterium]|nr:YkgJ family cysteine cluster protein [Nitrospirota bacterium]